MFARILARATALVVALVIASAGRSTGQPAGLTTLRVISAPSDDLRPVLYGQSAGLFRRAGLNVVVERANSGAVAAQAVIGGASEVGKASLSSLIAAYARGVPFVLIAPSAIHRSASPNSAVIVAASSPVHSPLDLQGKIVACTAIGDIGYLGLRGLIDAQGGDSSTVRWVEIPTSAVAAAIEQGRVEAGLAVEPFMSKDLRSGKVRMLVDVLSGYPIPILESAFFATRAYVAENRDLIVRFARVLQQAAVYSNAHPAETARLFATFSGMDPELTAQMHLTYTATSFDPLQIQPVIDLAVKYKIIPHKFDAQEILISSVTR